MNWNLRLGYTLVTSWFKRFGSRFCLEISRGWRPTHESWANKGALVSWMITLLITLLMTFSSLKVMSLFDKLITLIMPLLWLEALTLLTKKFVTLSIQILSIPLSFLIWLSQKHQSLSIYILVKMFLLCMLDSFLNPCVCVW